MTASARAPVDRPALAVVAVVVSVFALSFGDAVIKRASVSLPLWQLYVLRSALIVPALLGILLLRCTPPSLRPLDLRWTLVRSALLVLMWVVYYAALPKISLSVAAAAYYTSPLIITLMASRLSGDRVTPTVWAAVALGFAGVLVMLRPGADPVDIHVVLPLLAACPYAAAMLVTRTRCAEGQPLVLALALNLSFIVVGVAASVALHALALTELQVASNRFVLGGWVALGPDEWSALAVLALAMLIGSIGAAVAYQSGPAPLVASFDYGYLVFAAVWGYAFFAEVPDAFTMTGMAMILIGGVIAVTRGRA